MNQSPQAWEKIQAQNASVVSTQRVFPYCHGTGKEVA
jgi:hypothetical protein